MIPAELSIKELAEKLGRHSSYVYAMRTMGFPMRWNLRSRCLLATEQSARNWIAENKFRVLKGRATIGRE
jgi:hypothetical protein